MNNIESYLNQPRPASLNLELPRKESYFPSPADWRDEILYFLLPDRFSDGKEFARPLLDRENLWAARPTGNNLPWNWAAWADSGAVRWQGGTLKGIESKLDYLSNLGVTALWIGPVFKQRGHLNTYHGYGIQDFLEIDPHFGSRRDLVDLIAKAHEKKMRVILDIIFNHSGTNWSYPGNQMTLPYIPYPQQYPFGSWLDYKGQPTNSVLGENDGVFPSELQNADYYTRAGKGDLGAGDINDSHAEHKRSDFLSFRDFNLDTPNCLRDLAQCYKYWIALTDCDGFRLDTLKHVSTEQARNFCGSIKEFAVSIGKSDYFLVGEIAGGDYIADRYLDVLEQNLNAALDIGESKLTLKAVAQGAAPPSQYFNGFNSASSVLGSHRNLGNKHVSILDDHDQVFGEKLRFSSTAASARQVVVPLAIQLFTLGIPCIYYGTEQSLAGPEEAERHLLPGWNNPQIQYTTRYLREAMFGPENSLKSGLESVRDGERIVDPASPGFGPFGTSGHHCFDVENVVYKKLALLANIRHSRNALRGGRQYLRPIADAANQHFREAEKGDLIAWSRILDEEECLCVVNPTGDAKTNQMILIDANLNASGGFLEVLVNTAEIGETSPDAIKKGTKIPVYKTASGTTFITVESFSAFEAIILTNRS